MRILVFSAHVADFCSRAGGTLARHVRAGDRAKVVALTYGERSESGGLYAAGARPPLEEVKAEGFLLSWYTDQARLRAFQAQRLSGSQEIRYAEAFERTGPWVGQHLPVDEIEGKGGR